MEPGATPWLVCMVAPGVKTAYWQSTHLVKSLYILKMLGIAGNDIKYAIIETTDELLRETFENKGVPQCIYIKDSVPFYAPWHYIEINDLLQFMRNPEDKKVDAMAYLQPVPNSVTVYPQYYVKEIGLMLKKISTLAGRTVKPFWTESMGLAAWYPSRLEQKFDRLCLQPLPKTAGRNFFYYFVIPYSLFGILPLLFISRCRRY